MSTGLNNIANASTRSVKASLTATAQQTQGEKDRKTIAENFDAFLTLLTTQLRNQSPLDPLDSNQFTQQLVQFSSVEQQLKTNDYLAAMAKNFGSGSAAGGTGGKLNAASAASLIGVEVTASGATQRLTVDPASPRDNPRHVAEFPVNIQANYTNYFVTIADENNNVVFSSPWRPDGAGVQTFRWNGVKDSGEKADPTKNYNIEVSGELVSNRSVKSLMSSERAGVVTSVDLSGSEEMVTFGGISVPLSQIKRVAKPTA
jgi:flagellar basal-body rod modification protein FlgD